MTHPAEAPRLTAALTRLAAATGQRPMLALAWAALIAAAALAAIDGMVRYPLTDPSIYIYVAEGILDGELPYRDRWDHKGPLTFYAYAAAVALGGVYGVWLFTLAALAAAAYIAFRLIRPLFGDTAAMFSLAFFLVSYRLVKGGPALPEHLALPFLLLALLLFARLHRGRAHPALTAAAIGALCAIAFLFKPSIVGLSLAIGLYWLLTWRRSWPHLIFGALGGLAVLLAAFAAMSALGILADYWHANVTYNLGYGSDSLKDRIAAIRHIQQLFGILAFALAAAWCLALYHAVTGSLRGKPYEHPVKLAIILAPIELAIAIYPGNLYGQYNVMLLPAITILAAYSVVLAAERGILPKNALSVGLAALAAFFLLNGLVFSPPYVVFNSYTGVRDRQLVDYVRAETDDADTIMLWGGAGVSLYWLSDRKAPSRFFFSGAHLQEHPVIGSAHLDEFMADVERDPPALIIDDASPLGPIATAVRRLQADPGAGPGELEPWFAPLYRFVAANYAPVDGLHCCIVYRLK